MFHIITDTHFGHDFLKAAHLHPNDFEEKIIRNWQERVAPTDTVIHLGDFGLEKDADTLDKLKLLPGKKILLRGNHDKQSPEYYMGNGFEFFCDELVMTLADVKILFTHRPRYNHSYDINIHGHHHNIHYLAMKNLFLPIALEVMGYAPIPVDERFLRKLTSLVERYWLGGKFPTPAEITICAFSVGVKNLPASSKKPLSWSFSMIPAHVASVPIPEHSFNSAFKASSLT